jgi:hypothetical protein
MSCGWGVLHVPLELSEGDRNAVAATNAELLATGGWAERWL